MKQVLLIFCMALAGMIARSQETDQELVRGNKLYREGAYDKAAEQFDRVLQRSPRNTTASYNLGNALYRNSKAGDAEKAFDNVIRDSRDRQLSADAWYNKGVTLSNQQKLEESIEAYKQSLRLNPTDSFARENLVRALRELKKKKDQEQEQQKKKKQEEKEKQQPKMNKQQVQQLLQALQEQEKQLQQKMQKMKVPAPGQPEKDW